MTGPSSIRFPPSASVLRRVRNDARSLAAGLGATASTCDAITLVVDELVNNAIEHGAVYRVKGQELSVDIGADGGHFTVDFLDPEMPDDLVRELARQLSEAAGGMPSLHSERGRGLFLIAVYMEELRVDVAVGGGLHLRGRLTAS